MPANTAAPSGFHTLRRMDSASPNYARRMERIAYNWGTKIAYGDPVFKHTDGTIRTYVAAGTTIWGIFRGCEYIDPNTGKKEFFRMWNTPTLASTVVVEAHVDSDPNMTFMAQVVGTALTLADMGKNMDITTSTSGAPNTAGNSVCSLSGTAANTATLPFRLLAIVKWPAINAAYNETYDNQWVEVGLNTWSGSAGTRTGQA